MAWPPPALPINITDATPQQTTHPDLHNKTGQAVNDTVAKVGAMDAALGNPWRAAEYGTCALSAGAMTGAIADVPITGVQGALLTLTSLSGHPAVLLNRSGLFVGRFNLLFAAPASNGGILFQTVLSGISVTTVQLPTVAGVPAQYAVPFTEYLAAGTYLYFQLAGLASAQSFSGGTFGIFEAGPFGSSVRT